MVWVEHLDCECGEKGQKLRAMGSWSPCLCQCGSRQGCKNASSWLTSCYWSNPQTRHNKACTEYKESTGILRQAGKCMTRGENKVRISSKAICLKSSVPHYCGHESGDVPQRCSRSLCAQWVVLVCLALGWHRQLWCQISDSGCAMQLSARI